ncbi:MAG TPA: helix-turn-helix transcriptional regulator [Pyrinomonadaceae bacterium]|nr:helix-turn-helix transcriptional regulator [Pyrinomonadaceae bacterium]
MGTPLLEARRLGEKLAQIRNALGLSQSEMLRRLGFEDVLVYNRISDYELGKREPPLPLLLQYARLAGVSVDDLIDDEIDLPSKLPTRRK